MRPFEYVKATDVAAAVSTAAGHRSDEGPDTQTDFIAGGTDLLQLMQENVRRPTRVVDITGLPSMATIEVDGTGARLGALVRMSDASVEPGLRDQYPVVVEALLASASPQVRNLATIGGNLLQRTRCGYFRDVATPCNKRDPGSGCPALDGVNRNHAILGASEACIATYAGDLAVALLAVDAELRIMGKDGERTLALAELHRVPGKTPWVETQLEPGELIVGIDLPPGPSTSCSHYLKVRERASFQWSIASAAVVLELDDHELVVDARVAVGGVATVPWRLAATEAALLGRKLDDATCHRAASLAADGALTRGGNEYKVALIRNTVARALQHAGGLR